MLSTKELFAQATAPLLKRLSPFLNASFSVLNKAVAVSPLRLRRCRVAAAARDVATVEEFAAHPVRDGTCPRVKNPPIAALLDKLFPGP